MCRFRKRRIPAEPSDYKYPFSELRDAVVRCVDLPQVNPIADGDKWLKKIEDPISSLGGKEALDVLEDKRSRAVSRDYLREYADQRVTVVS